MSQDNTDAHKKMTELLDDAKVAMVTTMTSDGSHVSRPMWLQDIDDDTNLWFFTVQSSGKVEQIGIHPEVNVSFSDQKHNAWVSINGTAEVVTDKEKMSDLWNPMLKAWFPDELETDGICLLKVNTQSGEYWDSPNSTAVNLFGMVKAAVTGKRAEGGENKTVEL